MCTKKAKNMFIFMQKICLSKLVFFNICRKSIFTMCWNCGLILKKSIFNMQLLEVYLKKMQKMYQN